MNFAVKLFGLSVWEVGMEMHVELLEENAHVPSRNFQNWKSVS